MTLIRLYYMYLIESVDKATFKFPGIFAFYRPICSNKHTYNMRILVVVVIEFNYHPRCFDIKSACCTVESHLSRPHFNLVYSLIWTHVWEPIPIPQHKVTHLSGQSIWEQRCPDKWGSTGTTPVRSVSSD